MSQQAFQNIQNNKLRQAAIDLTDKKYLQIQSKLIATYSNTRLLNYYSDMRENAPTSQFGENRLIVSFPNNLVFWYLDQLLKPQYGDNWLRDNRALNHELVKPWWVVKTL